MSQRQAKLIRKAFKTCPLLIAMYSRLDDKGYKGITRKGGKLSVLAPDKRRVYQFAKGLTILVVICSILLLSTGKTHHVKAENPVDTLIPAIIHVESRGNPKAVSKKGAIGLMQVMPLWVPALKKAGIVRKSKDELLDPTVNVKAGKFVLVYYLKKHRGDVRKALHGYSGGAKNYYRKVMEAGR